MPAWLQNGDWLTILQLILDGLLLVLVLALLWDRRRKITSAQAQHVMETFERILAESQTLSEAFEKNLRERGRLIEKVMGALDSKLEEARHVLNRLEQPHGARPNTASPEKPGPSAETLAERILRLADAGHPPQDIAARIRRPIGEVELVLSLHKLQQKKPAP